jgi:hypothetical protein
VVVATISLVVNLAAVGAALNGPDTPDIGSVFPSSPSSDLPTAPSDFFPSPVP